MSEFGWDYVGSQQTSISNTLLGNVRIMFGTWLDHVGKMLGFDKIPTLT